MCASDSVDGLPAPRAAEVSPQVAVPVGHHTPACRGPRSSDTHTHPPPSPWGGPGGGNPLGEAAAISHNPRFPSGSRNSSGGGSAGPLGGDSGTQARPSVSLRPLPSSFGQEGAAHSDGWKPRCSWAAPRRSFARGLGHTQGWRLAGRADPWGRPGALRVGDAHQQGQEEAQVQVWKTQHVWGPLRRQ